MLNKIKVLVVFIFFSFIFTSCDSNLTGDNLLTSPKLPVEIEEVKTIIGENLPSNMEFINPIVAENNNSIQFVDLDNDDRDEVLVFYKVSGDEYPVRISVLTKKNDYEWIINNTIKGVGYDVNKVVYMDMDMDGTKEIIVGWQGGTILNKGLSIYSYLNGDISEVYEDTYTEFDVSDYTNDGTKELIVVKLNRNEGISTVYLYDYYNKNIVFLDETDMDGYINAYYSINSGKASKNITGLFLDASVGAHSAFTDLIIYKNNELKNVFYDENFSSTSKTFKAYPRKSKDIDKDGIIEIPILIAPKGFENFSMADTPWFTMWYKWDGKSGLIKSTESYSDYINGFEFIFPFDWKEKITLKFENKNRTKILFLTSDEKQIPVFEILVLSSDEYEREINNVQDFEKVKATFKKVYLFKRYIKDKGSDFYLSKEEFESLLNLAGDE